jgi:hypothetical protein
VDLVVLKYVRVYVNRHSVHEYIIIKGQQGQFGLTGDKGDQGIRGPIGEKG